MNLHHPTSAARVSPRFPNPFFCLGRLLVTRVRPVFSPGSQHLKGNPNMTRLRAELCAAPLVKGWLDVIVLLADKLEELHLNIFFQKKKHEAELFITNFILSTSHVIYVKVKVVNGFYTFLTHDKYDKKTSSPKKTCNQTKGWIFPLFWVFFGRFTNVFPTSSKSTSKGGPFRRYVFPVRHGRYLAEPHLGGPLCPPLYPP